MFDAYTIFPAFSLFTASQSRGSPRDFIIWAYGSNPFSYSNDTDVKSFMGAHVFLGANDSQVDLVADKYSQDPAAVRFPAQSPETIRLSSPRVLHSEPETLAP